MSDTCEGCGSTRAMADRTDMRFCKPCQKNTVRSLRENGYFQDLSGRNLNRRNTEMIGRRCRDMNALANSSERLNDGDDL